MHNQAYTAKHNFYVFCKSARVLKMQRTSMLQSMSVVKHSAGDL